MVLFQPHVWLGVRSNSQKGRSCWCRGLKGKGKKRKKRKGRIGRTAFSRDRWMEKREARPGRSPDEKSQERMRKVRMKMRKKK